MRLELAGFPVRDARFGHATRLTGGTLEIDHDALLARLVCEASFFRSVSVDIARPGESTRIIHVLDAIEPRWKAAPAGAPTFPGWLGPPDVAGSGRTHRLDGVAVLTAGTLRDPSDADGPEGSQDPREAIIDMSGPGADYTPFGRRLNLVLRFDIARGVSAPEALRLIRLAGLRTATWLAEAATRELAPTETETFELSPADPGLPRVVYVAPMIREGALHTTFVYGLPIESLPLVLHPNEVLDGAIVNGSQSTACHRIPTYLYQNDPIIRGLYGRHGRELDFTAVLACRGLNPDEDDKRRQAAQVTKVARMLGAQGAVVTIASGGHGYVEQMLICQAMEQAGIRTVLGVDEYGDTEGTDVPLAFSVSEAKAIVSCGNQDNRVDLPAVERVLGGDRFVTRHIYEKAFARHPSEAISVGIRQLLAATAQVGFGRLTSRAF